MTGHKCHGKRVKIMMRVKLYSRSEFSLRWSSARLFFYLFFMSCTVKSRQSTGEALLHRTDPRPPATLPHSSSGNPTDRYNSGDRRTNGSLLRSFCGLHSLCLKKITYSLCFSCNTECCASLPCFPSLRPPCATLPLAWHGKKNIHRWVFAPSPAPRRA